MAAPTITWREVTGTTTGPTYTSIASLSFGTVTAGAWSVVQCVAPAVADNSIQSAKWWLYDVGGVRSAASVGMGTANSWLHRITATGTYVRPSAIGVSSGFGTEGPQSTGSAYAYADVSAGAYGEFVYLLVKTPSAAGDGAHTGWGWQLKYSYT